MTLLEEFKQIPSAAKDLRRFGVTMGVVGLILAIVAAKHGVAFMVGFAVPAMLFLATAAFSPRLLRPFQKVWMSLALVLGWGMTRALLSILYFGLITPMALLLRWMGKDFLDRKFPEKGDSCWSVRDIKIRDKKKYETQY